MSRRPAAPVRPSGATAGSRRAVRPTAGPSASGGAARPASRPPAERAPSGPRPAPPVRPQRATDPATEARPVRLARLLSVRAMVLGVVGLVGFTLLFPSVRAYLGQQAELEALEQELVAAQERQADLRGELDRWQDPAYVEAQARSRLSYVMPGETPYRVIDPEVVVEVPAAEGTTSAQTGPALPVGGSGTPWYTTIWDSVEVAGQMRVPGGEG